MQQSGARIMQVQTGVAGHTRITTPSRSHMFGEGCSSFAQFAARAEHIPSSPGRCPTPRRPRGATPADEVTWGVMCDMPLNDGVFGFTPLERGAKCGPCRACEGRKARWEEYGDIARQ